MATRVSRKTTTTSYSQQSTSGMDTSGSSTASPRRRERPPSPARITRMQEKEELINLNDRLAAYIDRVRYLESENSRLQVQVRSSEEIVKREVTSVKSLYETELADARKLLDETAKEKAKLQIEANKYKAEFEDLQTKYHRKDRDCQNLERRVLALEAENADLQGKLADAENRRKQLEKENASLRAEIATLQKQLATARKQLEDETLIRVDLENRVQSLKEDLSFKSQVYEQELEETRTRTTTELEEVDGRLQEQYEAKLQEALIQMRNQHEADLQQVKIELEVIYENKVADLQSQIDRSGASAGTAWEELRVTRKKLTDLSSELSKLRSENVSLEERLKDLEAQLAREREELQYRLAAKNAEIDELRQRMDDQTHEYADLLETKIKLDREIDAYRKLLEGEEARLNISATSQESTPRRTPSRPVQVRGQKRKRVALSEAVEEYSQKGSSSGYQSSASAKGGMEISDVDPDGQFIKLYNNSGKDINIGGWQIKHAAGEDETVYKFHRNIVAKAGQYITVWSSDTETTHDPPSDLVMKGQRWFVSDTMKTVLIHSKEEVASREMTKSQYKSSSSYRSSITGPRGEIEFEEGNGDKEKCLIM